jgi:hypothetical protein
VALLLLVLTVALMLAISGALCFLLVARRDSWLWSLPETDYW